MTKLKVFLDDDNCWWKMFKNQRFECCEQKVAHLHGYLDGSLVTLRMMEEPLDVRSSDNVQRYSAINCLEIYKTTCVKRYKLSPRELTKILHSLSATRNKRNITVRSRKNRVDIFVSF